MMFFSQWWVQARSSHVGVVLALIKPRCCTFVIMAGVLTRLINVCENK